MKRILKGTIILLIFGTILISFFFYFKIELYNTLVQEDGLIEYTTAFILLATSILLLFRLIKLRKIKKPLWIIFNTLMILGLFFGFGEEVSWGQRVFSIESGEFFIENNLQGEMNLHNLSVKGVKINKMVFSYGFTFVFGFYFIFSLLLFKKSVFVKTILSKIGVPIPKIQHTIVLLLGTFIIIAIPDSRKWELWECLFVLIFFLVLVDPFNTNEKLIPQNKQIK